MYFKWDLFRRHIKKWVNVAKMGLSGYFFVMEKTHKFTNVRMSVRLSVHPSIQVLTFYVKVLLEVFCSFLYFLKAYPLGCLCMISVTSI